MDIGLLLIRLVVGGLVASHGAQKLFGRLGGFGLAGTGGYLEGFGFRPGRLFAALAGAAELAGGVLFGAGLATPLAAALIAATMFVAARTDHAGKGLWIFNGGAEYVLTVAAIVVGIAVVGPGFASLDGALELDASGPLAGLGALVLAFAGAAVVLTLRGRLAAVEADEHEAAPGGEPRMDGVGGVDVSM
ncbi:MAG TPA: DoxX family protein [Candidatus Limnocylindrales bacterium]|nr:DoxX family protein [Candidatus Limnocylindrales bacterium]